MIGRIFLVAAPLGAAFALSAPVAAQFRVDLAPSAFRAARQPPKVDNDPVPGRLNALSPLGGRQGKPVNKPVTSAVEPVKAYAGLPDEGSTDPLRVIPGIGITGGKVEDNLVDDPNKPRKPLQPNSLKKGVAPRS
jgi:hypothetical protein